MTWFVSTLRLRSLFSEPKLPNLAIFNLDSVSRMEIINTFDQLTIHSAGKLALAYGFLRLLGDRTDGARTDV